MNWQAALDGLLAVSALWVAVAAGRTRPALRLACVLLGSAAVLGTLRFSGVLPLPPLHQFLSLLGAGVGLPLIAKPAGVVATQRRFTWIFGVVAAVLCVLLVTMAGLKLWSSVCAFAAALTVLGVGAVRKQRLAFGAGLCMVLAFVAFAAQLHVGAWQPGEFLHLGLAAGVLLLGRWSGALVTPGAAKTGAPTR